MHLVRMQLLVIDTESQYVSSGFAKQIAEAAKGSYYYLPTGVMSNKRMYSFTKQAVREAVAASDDGYYYNT